MSKSIAKNTAFMTAASVGQKIIAFVYFTLIARYIGAEGTGKYFFALAFTTVFVVFVDMGFTNVLVREAAKAKEKLQKYLGTVLSIKVLFGVLTYVAAVVTINLMGYPEETKNLVYLSGVTMLFDSIHLSFYGSLRAIGDLRYEAAGIIGSQLLTLCMGSIFLFLHLPLIYLILAFTIASGVNACFAGLVLKYKHKISLKPQFDKTSFRYLGRIAIPFALAAIFARVYSYIDSILLSKLAGDIAVGWYSIPYKITYAFQFLPLALVAALYPRFSEFFVSDKKRLAYVFERGLKYLLILAFPIAVGISVLAKDIILTIYTEEYINSIIPLQILIFSLVFSFISFPIGAFLNACNRQVTQTIIVAFVMITNIVLNLILIPRYSVIGASIAALVCNILLTKIGYLFVPTITKVSHWFISKTVLQLFAASLVMGVAVYYVNLSFHFTLAIVTGVLVYPIMLFVTRAVSISQLKEALQIVRR